MSMIMLILLCGDSKNPARADKSAVSAINRLLRKYLDSFLHEHNWTIKVAGFFYQFAY